MPGRHDIYTWRSGLYDLSGWLSSPVGKLRGVPPWHFWKFQWRVLPLPIWPISPGRGHLVRFMPGWSEYDARRSM